MYSNHKIILAERETAYVIFKLVICIYMLKLTKLFHISWPGAAEREQLPTAVSVRSLLFVRQAPRTGMSQRDLDLRVHRPTSPQ